MHIKKNLVLIYCLIFTLISGACSKISSKSLGIEDLESQIFLLNSSKGDYKLLWSLPKSWKLAYDNKAGNMLINEFLPKGQELASWSDMISFTVTGIEFDNNAAEIQKSFDQSLASKSGACKNFKKSDYVIHEQFGQTTLEFSYECPSSTDTPGSGEVNLFKVILAGDKIGLVQFWRSWKIRNNADLERARLELLTYRDLFRQINLQKI
jgi:hypothetical protein